MVWGITHGPRIGADDFVYTLFNLGDTKCIRNGLGVGLFKVFGFQCLDVAGDGVAVWKK